MPCATQSSRIRSNSFFLLPWQAEGRKSLLSQHTEDIRSEEIQPTLWERHYFNPARNNALFAMAPRRWNWISDDEDDDGGNSKKNRDVENARNKRKQRETVVDFVMRSLWGCWRGLWWNLHKGRRLGEAGRRQNSFCPCFWQWNQIKERKLWFETFESRVVKFVVSPVNIARVFSNHI